MDTKLSKVLKFAVASAFFILFASLAFAVSIGVSPGRLQFPEMLKSGYAERTVTVSTDSTSELLAHFEKDGDIKDWIRFEPYDEFFSLTLNNPYKVKVIVEPPADAKNGSYYGKLRFVTDRFGQITGRAGGFVKAAVQMDIDVNVTGVEVLKCRSGGFTILDTEQGFPIVFSATVVNDGNVRIRPKISIDIWDQFQTNLILSKDFSEDEVLPTVTKTISKQLSSQGLPIGQYWATISVGDCKASDILTFSIVEKGGIVDKGTLVEINNKPWVYVGEPVQINSIFNNDGMRTVTSQFKGNIKLDDKIVQVIESDLVDVPSHDSTTFTSYFTPEKPGRYIIQGRVHFNNKITFEKSSVINVNPVLQASGKIGVIQLLIYIVIVTAIIYLIRIIVKEKRRKN
jgi:hypothetical protein